MRVDSVSGHARTMGVDKVLVNGELVFLFGHTPADQERMSVLFGEVMRAQATGADWVPTAADRQHLCPKAPPRKHTEASAAALFLAPWLRHHSDCERERREGECSCGLNAVLARLRPELKVEPKGDGD